jgi:sphingomyelin phosphodiesterase acid-like 3
MKCYFRQKLDLFLLSLVIFALGCWNKDHHQNQNSPRTPGHFGDYLCDSPWSLLESASQAMKDKQGDNVEFVLWTG